MYAAAGLCDWLKGQLFACMVLGDVDCFNFNCSDNCTMVDEKPVCSCPSGKILDGDLKQCLGRQTCLPKKKRKCANTPRCDM